MAKVKVTTKFDILDALKNKKAFPRQFTNRLGEEIIKEIKKAISRGQSPVRKFGRFKGYAKQRLGKGYPEGIEGKKNRPVNLFLSGDMLNELVHTVGKRQGSLKVGIDDTASTEIRVRARVHNSGERSDIPQRKFIPNEPGEEFLVLIMRRIRSLYNKQWKSIIDKTNK